MNSSLLNRRKQDQEQGSADSYHATQKLASDKKIAASCSSITTKNSGNRSILLVLIADALLVAHSSHWVNQVQSQSSILNAEDMGSDNDKVKSTNQKTLWTSEHLIDCQKMLKLNINHEDSHQENSTGGGAPEPIVVTTKTDPTFQMSIHRTMRCLATFRKEDAGNAITSKKDPCPFIPSQFVFFGYWGKHWNVDPCCCQCPIWNVHYWTLQRKLQQDLRNGSQELISW